MFSLIKEDEARHVLHPDDYTLVSHGHLGVNAVLTVNKSPQWLEGKILVGEAGTLDRDGGPIEVTKSQRWLELWYIYQPIGKPTYRLAQGGKTLLMTEGNPGKIKDIIDVDR